MMVAPSLLMVTRLPSNTSFHTKFNVSRCAKQFPIKTIHGKRKNYIDLVHASGSKSCADCVRHSLQSNKRFNENENIEARMMDFTQHTMIIPNKNKKLLKMEVYFSKGNNRTEPTMQALMLEMS
jgi:hypothetical protein